MGQDKVNSMQIITDATATGTALSKEIQPWQSKKAFHGHGVTSSGAGACDIGIQASNDGVNWMTIDTLSLTLSSTVIAASQDNFVVDAPWKYIRGSVLSISGTGATVQLFISQAM